MTGSNGKGTMFHVEHSEDESQIVTPEQVMIEHAARLRRARKPTLGEVEDAMNDFARTMLNQYGPLAVALREMRLDFEARLHKLERQLRESSGDSE